MASGVPDGTQGRVVALLQAEPRTVDDLARGLGLTGNAIRGHLAALAAEGWVEVVGQRPSSRKPAALYGLTAGAEAQLSKAYLPLLHGLLGALAGKLTAAEYGAILREAGRRLAATQPRAGGSRAERVALAARALESLGGKIRSERRGRGTALVAAGCPIAEVVRLHPEACRVVETFVTELVGEPAKEQCDRGARPRCTFTVGG